MSKYSISTLLERKRLLVSIVMLASLLVAAIIGMRANASQPSPHTLPNRPVNVTATQEGSNIVVRWDPGAPNNSWSVTSYGIVQGSRPRDYVQVGSVSAASPRQFTVTGNFVDGQLYAFSVYASTGMARSYNSAYAYVTYQDPQPAGRGYPWHTNINATTFWVGEQFQDTDDGSQICSAYDGAWQFSHFGVKPGEVVTTGCDNPYPQKCDAVKINQNGPCSDGNVVGSIYLPQNDYQPVGGPASIQNPFYLDLPYNDYGTNGEDGYVTGSETRCQDIPWANDPGYAGKCDDDFSYMKNRWVEMTGPSGQSCYGQIQDAGPADIGNGNPNYADRAYVFGANDARPYNQSYDGAGADVSPALNACLGGEFNETVAINWRFVDDIDVPAGPWKRVVTTSGVNW